jgi:hypothetical protein
MGHAVAILEEVLHLRDLEGPTHSIIDSSEHERVAFLLVANIGAD